MKLSNLAIIAVLGSANAMNSPELSVSLTDGSYDCPTGALDPKLSWSTSSSAGDIDLDFGVEASPTASMDVSSMTDKIWGKATGSVAGWGVTARAEFQGTDFSEADVDIDLSGDGVDIHLDATAGSGFAVNTVTATSDFDVDGGSMSVTPSYDVGSGDADVTITYDKGDTSVKVVASADDQSITVSKDIDGDNRIAPTLTSGGDISVEYERRLARGDSLITTVTPNESIDMEWKDNEWTASISMPIDGTEIKGTNVSVKRSINPTTFF